jgi:hypothetical protein
MPPPQILIIETEADTPEKGALLYRLNSKGECVGDTWHESIDAAKEYASEEYGKAALIWRDVPADIEIDELEIEKFGATVLDNR